MLNHSGNISMEDAKRLAESPTGRELLGLLQQTHSEQLQEAMSKASSGDMVGAKNALSDLLSSPQIREMLRRMEDL